MKKAADLNQNFASGYILKVNYILIFVSWTIPGKYF